MGLYHRFFQANQKQIEREENERDLEQQVDEIEEEKPAGCLTRIQKLYQSFHFFSYFPKSIFSNSKNPYFRKMI